MAKIEFRADLQLAATPATLVHAMLEINLQTSAHPRANTSLSFWVPRMKPYGGWREWLFWADYEGKEPGRFGAYAYVTLLGLTFTIDGGPLIS